MHITANQSSVPMGCVVCVNVTLEFQDNEAPQGYILLPFVNGRRWGAHERSNAEGRVMFLLPLPNPGPAHLQIVALSSDTDHWMGLERYRDCLLVGRRMPEAGIRSNVLEIEVTWRAIPSHKSGDTLFGMQWEPWFTRGVEQWRTAQAVPIVGFYDSYNRDVTRQHILWFMELGVDFILPDWTNHLWGLQHWDERSDDVNAIVHATTLTLETLAEMRDEGLPVPKMVLFPGLSNGHPTTMEALNEEFAWIFHTYVRNPRFEGLWQEFDGKPLIVVLDTGAVGDPRGTAESAFRIPFFKDTLALEASELDAFRAAQGPVDDRYFTVRWMSSQNQTTRHHELGYWSWMDGVIAPPVTYRNGIAESVTVTPSFFNAEGWTGPLAVGRCGGATYLETFEVALRHRPRVIFLHQWQEYSGQIEGHGHGYDHNIYTDTYSVELSDDLEPVSLTAPGYRGDQGGWGFYYLNLTRALIDLYRHPSDTTISPSTLLAVSVPLPNAIITGETLRVNWSVIGPTPSGFTLCIDGVDICTHLTGTMAEEIALDALETGPHILSVIAEGVTTRYPLSSVGLDAPLLSPIPVQVNVSFMLKRYSQ